MKKIIMSCAMIFNLVNICQEMRFQFPSSVTLKGKFHTKNFNNFKVMKLADRLGSKNMELRGVAFEITSVSQEGTRESIDLASALVEYVSESEKKEALEKLQKLLED